jgi:hypothetical protein
VWVYVFDSNGIYVKTVHGNAYTAGYQLTTDLMPGSYQFVVWTNINQAPYAVSHTGEQLKGMHIDDLHIFLNASKVINDIPNLHHGDKTDVITLKGSNVVDITIIPNTYKVTFKIEGLPYSVTTSNATTVQRYSYTATDKGYYNRNFDNSIKDRNTNDFVHERTNLGPVNVSSTSFDSSIILLGLNDKPARNLRFVFSNTTANQKLYPSNAPDADLTNMIIDAYKAQHKVTVPHDFGKVFEFIVPLKFTAEFGMTLNLDYWNKIEHPGGLI